MSENENTNENEDTKLVQEELNSLKSRADLMGISYHPSIGAEKLREKINAAMAQAAAPKEPEKPAAPLVVEESAAQRRARKRREANELVRIRVSCMNPAKKEWDGEIFTVGNSTVGSFTKFIPFNAEDGWHVPRIIYNQLVDRQCQIFVTTKDPKTGAKKRVGKLIKEFAIEVLPNLTPEELNDLAQRQAMAKSIG